MNDKERYHRNLRKGTAIFVILISIAAIMPLSLKNEFQTNKNCDEPEKSTWMQQRSNEEKINDQFECSPDYNNNLIRLFIAGIINIDELTLWVLSIDRRVVVLKMMHEKRLMQASDIAGLTDRSLQNISYAMRELEEQGLIRCINPEKHTWKKFIPTEKGNEVFEKLKKNHYIET